MVQSQFTSTYNLVYIYFKSCKQHFYESYVSRGVRDTSKYSFSKITCPLYLCGEKQRESDCIIVSFDSDEDRVVRGLSSIVWWQTDKSRSCVLCSSDLANIRQIAPLVDLLVDILRRNGNIGRGVHVRFSEGGRQCPLLGHRTRASAWHTLAHSERPFSQIILIVVQLGIRL